jgi:hypothetical protein
MTNNQTTCQECFRLKNQVVLAQHYWNKGLFECQKWLCQICYWEAQTQWTIWEEQEKQAIAKYLSDSANNSPNY